MTASLSLLGLICDDIPESTRYYTEVLGFKVNEAESIPGFYTQFETQGGAMFALLGGFGDAPELKQRFDASLGVKNIDATFADWKEKGVEIVTEIQEMPFGRTFLARTPDDHVLRVWQPPA